MRIVKFILFGLAALVVLLLIIALILPGTYRIEKSVEIKSPVDSVFAQVSDYNKFKLWNPWSLSDPKATFTVSGSAATVGHKYDWSGETIGKGGLTITEVVPNKSLVAKLAFIEPQVSGADDIWAFEPTASGGTKVVWVNSGALAFPMERLFGPFLTKMLNKQFEEGLNNLKNVCEKGKL